MPITILAAALVCAGQKNVHAVVSRAQQITPKLSLGAPIQAGNIALIPIEASMPLARDKYLTLAEAAKLGVIEILEVPGQEQVNALTVVNRSNMPILLFAGELLLGGKQDRIVAEDSEVPPRSKSNVPVYCVEHGRWQGVPKFEYGKTLVPNAVRKAAQAPVASAPIGGGGGGFGGAYGGAGRMANQSQVWNSVAASNAKVAASPSTGTVRGTLFDANVQASANRLVSEMNTRFHPDAHTVGVICVIDGKIESADVFGNAEMFAASREELFRSYAVDAHLSGGAKRATADMRACENFLAEITQSRRQSDQPGHFRIMTKTLDGVESGRSSLGAGLAGAGGGGFTHGSYRPNGGQ
jgi:hypothetical protein